MNHPGEVNLDGFPVGLLVGGSEWESPPTHHPLAIVGSHSSTRDLAPYDDPRFEIWLFNESAQKPEVYKHWDGLLQIHTEKVYSSPTNWVNKDHWEWLQQDHGDGRFGHKRIFMQTADPRVPNAVEYPLTQILRMVPYRYLRSSPAMALALAIHLGYKEVWLYGSELGSSTEYAYQAINYAFWIGFAHGCGIDLHLECWQSEFNRPIYGYEGEAQIEREYFAERAEQHRKTYEINQDTTEKLRTKIELAMYEHKFDMVGDLSANIETASASAGEAYGAMNEAKRYSEREDMISRQEFERTSGYAMIDGQNLQRDTDHKGGECQYVWNAWKLSGRIDALNQLRVFMKDHRELAFKAGEKLGVYRENIHYQVKYDELVQALGGTRALHHLEKAPQEQMA